MTLPRSAEFGSFTSFIATLAAQTDDPIITPASGKRLQIRGVYISNPTPASPVTLVFNAVSDPDKPVMHMAGGGAHFQAGSSSLEVTGEIDEPLNCTCPANTFVNISYAEY